MAGEKSQPADHHQPPEEPQEEEEAPVDDDVPADDSAPAAAPAAARVPHDVHRQDEYFSMSTMPADYAPAGAPLPPTSSDEALAHQLHMEELMDQDPENRGWRCNVNGGWGAALDLPVAFVPAGSAGLSLTARNQAPTPVSRIMNTRELHVAGAGRLWTTTAIGMPSQTPAAATASAGWNPSAAATALGIPIAPLAADDDFVSKKRRDLLADANSPTIFAGMEEEDDNGFYESIIPNPDDDEKPEQAEKEGLHESLQQCLTPRSDRANNNEKPYNDNNSTSPVAVAGDAGDEEEFCLDKFCDKWGISPSHPDLHPDDSDEAGPSTKKRTKVPPLADDEIPKFGCSICMETLPVLDLFHSLPCKHKFCAPCMSTYVEARIRAGELPIPCPDPSCKGGDGGKVVLHPEKCKKAIDYAAFSDWGARITESALLPSRRAYCPNPRCGVMLETAACGGGQDQEPAKAPCPACKHLLCATCGQEWSADGPEGAHDCAHGPDAVAVKKLAAEQLWQTCPKCKMYVEKIAGCNTMKCRCGFFFCYRCGHPMTRQAEGDFGEPCRCSYDTGLGFAFPGAHQHHQQAPWFDMHPLAPQPGAWFHRNELPAQAAARWVNVNELPPQPGFVGVNRQPGFVGVNRQPQDILADRQQGEDGNQDGGGEAMD